MSPLVAATGLGVPRPDGREVCDATATSFTSDDGVRTNLLPAQRGVFGREVVDRNQVSARGLVIG